MKNYTTVVSKFYEKENGAWTWQLTDGENTVECTKEFPNEHAARRNLERYLKKPKDAIPPASAKTNPPDSE